MKTFFRILFGKKLFYKYTVRNGRLKHYTTKNNTKRYVYITLFNWETVNNWAELNNCH